MALSFSASQARGALFGPHPTAAAPPKDIRHNQYGSPVPLVIGRGVVTAQVVYQAELGSADSGYVWNGTAWSIMRGMALTPAVVLAICEAPVTSIVRCYKRFSDTSIGILAADLATRLTSTSGGSVAVITAATASAWAAYVGTPYEGMAHSGTCHVRVTNALLGDDGKMPETRWEVQGTIGVTATSTPDAEPADFLVWLLTDATHGLGYDASMVNVDTGIDGSAASSYRRYTRARGWYFSRVIDQSEKISEIIEQLLLVTNSTLVWVDGKYTAVPLDDESSSTSDNWPGHGTYPYTAVTSYVSIGDDDFVGRADPVQVERQPRVMVPSIFPIEYTLRHDESGDIQYPVNHAEYQSDVFSSANGIRRADAFDLTKWILKERHAWFVSYLTAQRTMYHRSRYTFRVKPKFGLVAPGDFISLSDSMLGLSGVMCRAETVEEGSDGVIEIEALEWPNGSTKGFTLGTTTPSNVNPARPTRVLASNDLLTTPPNVVDVVKLTDSQKDRDNLWFNPSSEIDPPAGADTAQGEWVDRYQAGAPPASYSGSWVRQKSDGVPSGFWLPCSPGAMFYAEAQVKRTSGTNTGGRLAIEFYPTLGTRTGVLASAYSTLVTSASWTLTQVTSAAAPAGTNAVFIGYACPTADTCYFDALYARRVMQAETIASEVLSVTWGTGWSTTPITYLRRSAGLVVGDMGVTAAAGAAWTSIFTLPVGARPLSNVHIVGLVADQSSGLSYVGRFLIDTAGVCQLVSYDNETSVVAPFAIGVGDFIQLNFAFPWI